MAFTNLEKSNTIFIYGEARERSEQARTFVNVVQHLREFERFEMNKRDPGR
jgi:hypothetical protein